MTARSCYVTLAVLVALIVGASWDATAYRVALLLSAVAVGIDVATTPKRKAVG